MIRAGRPQPRRAALLLACALALAPGCAPALLAQQRAPGPVVARGTLKAGLFSALTNLLAIEGPGIDRGAKLRSALAFGGALEIGRQRGRMAGRINLDYTSTELDLSMLGPGPNERVRVPFLVADVIYRPLRAPRAERPEALAVLGGLGVKRYLFESEGSDDHTDVALHLGGQYDFDMGEWTFTVELATYLSRYNPNGTAARMQGDLLVMAAARFRMF